MGRTPVNLLVLGFIWHGLAVPLFWQAFPHDGNSNTAVHLGEGGPKAERIALLERLMALLEVHFPHLPVAGPLDDREFVGSRWFTYLRARRLPRCIRIRANTRLGSRKARDWSRSLRVEEARALRGKRRVLGRPCGWWECTLGGRHGSSWPPTWTPGRLWRSTGFAGG